MKKEFWYGGRLVQEGGRQRIVAPVLLPLSAARAIVRINGRSTTNTASRNA